MNMVVKLDVDQVVISVTATHCYKRFLGKGGEMDFRLLPSQLCCVGTAGEQSGVTESSYLARAT